MTFPIDTRPVRRPRRAEAGATTAEYAVGTLGACTVAGVLAQVGADDWFVGLLRDLLARSLDPRSLVELVGRPLGLIRSWP